ncbi:MAG TPA: Rrf2 family transcriptional regulator [Anaerolineales bacterium]|nr:Rrf2 family transcriptional regulator [Anaerolineales bacterium]
MRLSKRGEYGIRSMLYLAKHSSPGELIQLKQIAAKEHIPAKYLEQILLSLRHAGLLHSRMGIGGGYSLAKSADTISLGQIVRTLDGPLAPVNCVSQMAYEPCDCPDEKTCSLRLAMLDVRNSIANVMDNTTLADVVSRSSGLGTAT